MTIAVIILSAFLWCIIGVAGYLFWWGHDWLLNSSDFRFSLIAGLLGPMAWYVGWRVHGKG